MELWLLIVLTATFVAVAYAIINRLGQATSSKPENEPKIHIGDITLESLRYYCGYDFMRPILVAIRGKVYDVSKDAMLFCPGKPLHVYAGLEISRALAKGSLQESDCTAQLHDLSEEEMQRLQQEQEKYGSTYEVVGQVVPLEELSLEELSLHDGTHADKPLRLAIQGVVYDVTKGSQFYGPDGIYPFAGHECARAFALMSTELSDCNDNLEGLSYTEKETLQDWDRKFKSKYPIVGKIIKKSE